MSGTNDDLVADSNTDRSLGRSSDVRSGVLNEMVDEEEWRQVTQGTLSKMFFFVPERTINDRWVEGTYLYLTNEEEPTRPVCTMTDSQGNAWEEVIFQQ